MKPASIASVVAVGILAITLLFGGCYVVDPGQRGVKTTLGSMDKDFIAPGAGLKLPLLTDVKRVSVQQDAQEVKAACYSSDLQQVNLQIKVLYRIPEASVVSVVRDFAGEPFDRLVLPRVQEAIKEVVAVHTASDIVKTREAIKTASLLGARKKIGDFLVVEDLVIENVDLSDELEKAIEQKMVQQQESERAKFKQEQARTDAETAVIKAKGEAEAIEVQSKALEKNPAFIELEMVKKWNGIAPQVVGTGGNIMLPITPSRSQSATP